MEGDLVIVLYEKLAADKTVQVHVQVQAAQSVFRCVQRVLLQKLTTNAGDAGERAEFASAGMVICHSFLEVAFLEVRPRPRAEMELRVRRLPEQEIGQALLSSSTNDKVGVRDLPG